MLATLLFAACSSSAVTPTATSEPKAVASAPTATHTTVPATPTSASPPTVAVFLPRTTPSPTAVQQSDPSGLVRPAAVTPAIVVKVVDGDTLDVDLGRKVERIRLIGIDTPETVDPRKPVQCFGREASNRAKELLDGKTVWLEADPSQGERDDTSSRRLLRYVWLSETVMFNYEMVARGYAHEYTYETPYKYQQQFKQAQAEARDAERGLWSPTTCDGDTEQPADGGSESAATATPKPAAQPTATPPPSTDSKGVPPVSKDDCPSSHPIKGN